MGLYKGQIALKHYTSTQFDIFGDFFHLIGTDCQIISGNDVVITSFDNFLLNKFAVQNNITSLGPLLLTREGKSKAALDIFIALYFSRAMLMLVVLCG